jgi:benzaldehyde dehydrogenase (NAD)
VGDPLNDGVGLGPLINSVQRDRVDKIVQTSVQMGARLIEGGAYEGNFYRPTVLDNVTDDMPAFTEEIFGPVAPVTVVRSEPEALRLVNSQRNLVSAVYTADLLRGLAFAEQVDSDLVHVNDALGRPTGEDDLLIFTRPRWIGLQRSRLEFPF